MNWFEKTINWIPVVGTVKGAAQAIFGDTEAGVQAMKDSTKLTAITLFVVCSSLGAAAISEADDEFDLEDRCDAGEGTAEHVKSIWNW